MRNLRTYLDYTKLYVGIGVAVLIFIFLTVHIFIEGFHALSFEFIFGINAPEGESLFPAMVNTLIIIFLTLVIAVPVGIGSAIYLNEYASQNSKLVKIIRLTSESLAGIPSVIFGLFGFLFFVIFLGWSWSILAGVLTLSIMVLPTIMRSTEESLKAVPKGYREGSLALGADKLRTILKVLLPSAKSGILVSVILSVGRIVGESAALIFTAGTVMKIPENLFAIGADSGLLHSGSTMAVYMYTLTTEGANYDKAYATAIVLLLIVLCINILTKLLLGKMGKDGGDNE